MGLEQKYRRAYESLAGIIDRRKKEEKYAAFGYTSNLDLLCDFQVEQLNSLLENYMPDAELEKMHAPAKIRTMEELLVTLVYYCSQGIGGEVDVENTRLVEEQFHFKHGMGGTAMQAALALSEIGCPSVVHLTDDSKEVCSLLDTPFVHTVSRDGRLVRTDEIVQSREQEIHFIIQFKKGDRIRLGKQMVEIPCSNRLILTKVTVNEEVPLYEPYFNWVERNARHVDSNVLSSFNGIVDMQVLKSRLDYVERHVGKYRRNNPEGIVFFEDAHYHDNEIRRLCQETLYADVDIASLNEEELQYTLKKTCGFDVDTDNIISCVKGAELMREKFGIRKGVIVHTKDYSMYVGSPLKVDIEAGLMYGNMLATAKAKNGWYVGMEQVKEILQYGMSQQGMKNYRMLSDSAYASRAVLVPTKYIDKPKYTIGLGDSFVGGVQLCF